MSKFSHDNELIRKRRKKRAIKRLIFFFIFLLFITCILCVKLPYFNIAGIKVVNNKIVSRNEIVSLAKIEKGSNIFWHNFKEIKRNVMTNPYISDANISIKLPNIIEISVEERDPRYFIQIGEEYALLDKNAVLLERRESIEDLKLIQITGIDISNVESGNTILNEKDDKLVFIKTISDLMERKKEGVPEINAMDLSDINSFKVNYNNILVILGDGLELENKLNKVINILAVENTETAKGYIDVSFNGFPVVSIQR